MSAGTVFGILWIAAMCALFIACRQRIGPTAAEYERECRRIDQRRGLQ